MKGYLFFISCFFFSVVNAQDYVIRHDQLTGNTTYFKVINQKKDTVKVDQINLKKQSHISLNVQNFNPFYWGAKVTVYRNPVDESGSSSVFNPFSLFTKVMQGFLPASFPLLDLASDKVRGGDENTPQGKMLRLVQNYNRNYTEIRALSLQYNNLKNLEWQLNQLKFDIKKTEAEIKSTTSTAVGNLLPTDQLNSDGILVLGNKIDVRTKEVTDSFFMIRDQIQQVSKTLDVNETIANDRSTKDLLSEMDRGKVSVEAFTQKAVANPNIFTEEILSVGKLYNEIINTPFKYSFTVNSDPDINQLKLAVYPKMDSESKDTITKYFPVHNRNTIRIKNSLGLIFTYFQQNAHSYFTRSDSSIGQSKGNLFSPAIGTFINFYRSGQGGLKWGGTVGFGLPLQNDAKEFQFLLGLSAIIGRNEAVIISAGLAGGKVNKLKNDWKIGDKVAPENFENLTKSVYDIGGFFSVSLNLSALASQKK